MKNLNRLFRLIRQEDVVLFVGAGVSLGAGLPSGRKLIELLCDDLYDYLDDSEISNLEKMSLDYVADEYIKCRSYSRNSLNQILLKQFGNDDLSSESHRLIASIPHFKHIVSTNYDVLFEKYLPNSLQTVVVNDEDCSYINDNKTTVYKIHGDIKNFSSIILSKSDYDGLNSRIPTSLLWHQIKSLFAKNTVLFMGFSFDDSDIDSTFSTLMKVLGRNQKEMYFIAPEIDASKRGKLEKYRLTPIQITAEYFLVQLLDDIKANIKRDYENQEVSAMSFNRFCHQYGLTMSTVCEPEHNTVNGIKALSGEVLKPSTTIHLEDEASKWLESLSVSALENPSELYGEKLDMVRGVELKKEQIKQIHNRINGITIENMEGPVFIQRRPLYEGVLTIETAENKYDGIHFKSYKLGREMLIDTFTPLYTHSGVLKLEKRLKRKSSFVGHELKLNDTYNNFEEATKWLRLLEEVNRGDMLTVTANSRWVHSFGIQKNADNLAFCKQLQEYYCTIKEIERLCAESFEKYNNYTPDNYRDAHVIHSYLASRAFPLPLRENEKTFKYKISKQQMLLEEDGTSIIGIWDDKTSKFNINDKEFNVGHGNLFHFSCDIIEIEEVDDGLIVTASTQMDVAYIYFGEKRTVPPIDLRHHVIEGTNVSEYLLLADK